MLGNDQVLFRPGNPGESNHRLTGPYRADKSKVIGVGRSQGGDYKFTACAESYHALEVLEN